MENQQEGQTARVITTSSVLKDLQDGLTRSEIQTKYELSGAELKTIFSKESLKGKKTHKARRTSFTLVDDLADGTSMTEVAGNTNPEMTGAPEQEAPAAEATTRRRGNRSAAIPTEAIETASQTSEQSGGASEEEVQGGAQEVPAQEEVATEEVAETPVASQDEVLTPETEEVQPEDDRSPFDRV